jgi:hypothetical protein
VADGLSPGPLWVSIASGNRSASGASALPAEVLPLVPDAVKRMNAERENVANHDVDIKLTADTIELIFLGRLAPGEQLHPGGGTSLGREVHLIYDRKSGSFKRLHFSR